MAFFVARRLLYLLPVLIAQEPIQNSLPLPLPVLHQRLECQHLSPQNRISFIGIHQGITKMHVSIVDFSF